MTSINSIKSRIAALFSSAGAIIGACCGGVGVCAAGGCGGLTLPLFGFLGLSSSALHFLEKLKPVFLLITIMSLAYAFYKAYKPKPAASFEANCDAPNSPCRVPEKQTFVQSKSFLWAITIVCAIMWLYPYAGNMIPKPGETSGLGSHPPCSVPCNSQSPKISQ